MKKMKKISLIFIALSMFFSCNHTKKADCIKLGKSSFQYTSVEEYLAKKQEQIVVKLGKSSFQYTSVEEYLAKKQEQIVD
ncbi:hypothetical protein DXA95_17465, partial [Odoribacter sp. OF09-27XD]